MVGVRASKESKTVTIVGHGLTVGDRFALAPGVLVLPNVPHLDLDVVASNSPSFEDYATTIHGGPLGTFALEISESDGGDRLAVKAWNALWNFHLLSVACKSRCFSLFSVSDGSKPLYSAANRTPFTRPLTHVHQATLSNLEWARDRHETFDRLTKTAEFNAAVRCYGNAHFLPDMDVRIMLLWSGIEGLLSVDAELNRRLALYASLMLDGTEAEKQEYFERVKKAYGMRSRAVHGGKMTTAQLAIGYEQASQILVGLLARCVEIGRVPTPQELDRLAVTPTVR